MYAKKLLIFSNIRQIKDYKSKIDDGFVPTMISIDEFFHSFSTSKKRIANDTQRLIAMNKACQKTKNYEKLSLSNDFLSFLKNKEYLFSFFSELASQNVSINELYLNDTNSFFDEYLQILELTQKNYLAELEVRNLSDNILQSELKPNEFLLKQFSDATIFLDGFLKKVELEFLQNCTKFLKIKIRLKISIYNQSLMQKSFNLDFLPNYIYEIELFENGAKILSKNKCEFNKILKTAAFKKAHEQYIYALYLAQKLYKDGRKVCIIMPDENAATCLKSLDFHNYLNIAAGVKTNEISQILDSYFIDSEYQFSLANTQKFLLKTKDLKLDFCDLASLKKQLLALSDNDEIKQILSDRMDAICEIDKEFKLSTEQILALLDSQNITISHTNGGDISVLGVLESRGIDFDAVIVLDFNDDLVPKRNVAELFLNNSVRTRAGLISYEDRQNLQRHFYSQIFNAKTAYVLYLENEEKSPARMLIDYECRAENVDAKGLLQSFLDYKNGSAQPLEDELKIDLELVKKHDFFAEPLSFSRLECYLQAPFEYYLKYICKVKEPANLDEFNLADKGKILHAFFENANLDGDLLAQFRQDERLKNILNSIEFATILTNLKSLDGLLKNSTNRAREMEINTKIDNINCSGFIDFLSDETLIDYKFSSSNLLKLTHERQLAFYALMLNDFDKDYYIFYLKSLKKALQKSEKIEKTAQKLLEFLCEIKQNGLVFDRAQDSRGYYKLLATRSI